MTTEKILLNELKQAQNLWKTIAIEGIKEPNLKNVSDTLDKFFFLSKLKSYCAYLSYTQIVQADKLLYQKEDFRLIHTIISEGAEIMQAYPIFQIYNQICILFENFDDHCQEMNNLFLETQKTIYSQAKTFDKEEVLELYSYLTNYCIKKFNLGQTIYRERLFVVYNDLLNLKYYGQRQKQTPLPPQVYKNLVTYAILLRDHPLFKNLCTVGLPINNSKGFKNGLEWAELFVSIYKSKLDKKFRKIYPPYCAALLAFFQEDHLKAYKQLGNPSHIQGKFISLNIKTLQLRIIFEVQQIAPEQLEKDGIEIKLVMDAFRQLIRYEKQVRKQLKYQLNQYITFEKCFKALMKFHNAYFGSLYNSKNEKYLKDKVALELLIDACFGPYQPWFRAKVAAI